jgi:hypothetical protein
MKKLLTLLIAGAFIMPVMAADESPKTKQVCVDVQGKDGKPVIDPKTKKPKQDCKTVKIHKKHEGTEVPVKK